jgi:hypothetical protein
VEGRLRGLVLGENEFDRDDRTRCGTRQCAASIIVTTAAAAMALSVAAGRLLRFPLGVAAVGVLLALGGGLAGIELLEVAGLIVLSVGAYGIARLGLEGWRLIRFLRRKQGPRSGSMMASSTLWELLLRECVSIGASELRISEGVARVCHQGSWKDLAPLPGFVRSALVTQLKSLAQLDATSSVRAEGEARVVLQDREVLLRISVKPLAEGGEDVSVLVPATT